MCVFPFFFYFCHCIFPRICAFQVAIARVQKKNKGKNEQKKERKNNNCPPLFFSLSLHSHRMCCVKVFYKSLLSACHHDYGELQVQSAIHLRREVSLDLLMQVAASIVCYIELRYVLYERSSDNKARECTSLC